MKFTNEQLTKAKAAKSAEELLTLAKENGIALTEEEAAKYFAELNKEGELADDELDNVAGGCGDPDPKLEVGLRVAIGYKIYEILEALWYDESRGYMYKCKSLDRNDYGAIYEIYEDMFL